MAILGTDDDRSNTPKTTSVRIFKGKKNKYKKSTSDNRREVD
jgi:hypothetical protein